MESRKYQLQQQIIEALKANNNDLLSLLKSQWAHRFGVESLEELKNLDLTLVDQTPTNEDNLQNNQSQNYSFEVDEKKSIKEDDHKEKEIKNDIKKEFNSVDLENKELFEIKSTELIDKEKTENKTVSQFIEYKNPPKVEALIPLPPKPKYGYLKKWLLKS